MFKESSHRVSSRSGSNSSSSSGDEQFSPTPFGLQLVSSTAWQIPPQRSTPQLESFRWSSRGTASRVQVSVFLTENEIEASFVLGVQSEMSVLLV